MKYTLTLTRWHKVAERIHAAIKERETADKTALTGTTISPAVCGSEWRRTIRRVWKCGVKLLRFPVSEPLGEL